MADRTKRERYMLYRHGFRNGAASAAQAHPNEPDYMRGWAEGLSYLGEASDAFCKEIGYTPSILRASPSGGRDGG